MRVSECVCMLGCRYIRILSKLSHTHTHMYVQDKIDELDLVLFHNMICHSFHLCHFIVENGWLCILTMMEHVTMPPSSRPLSLSFCFLFSNSVLVFDTTGQLIYTHQKQCHHCENGQKAKGASKTPLSLPIHLSIAPPNILYIIIVYFTIASSIRRQNFAFAFII